MSTKYLRELLESVDVLNPERACEGISEALQELRQIETDRAKDAELIQMLVDDLARAHSVAYPSIAAAEAAGYKPRQWDI